MIALCSPGENLENVPEKHTISNVVLNLTST